VIKQTLSSRPLGVNINTKISLMANWVNLWNQV